MYILQGFFFVGRDCKTLYLSTTSSVQKEHGYEAKQKSSELFSRQPVQVLFVLFLASLGRTQRLSMEKLLRDLKNCQNFDFHGAVRLGETGIF